MHKGWYVEDDEDNGFAQFGGYMEAKKSKLLQQVREQSKNLDKKSEIFAGIAIFVNGHTKPSAEELKGLMGQHSGTYHIYQMPTTTHIIASNLPNVKINKLGPLPIVKPGWIEDSVTLGRLLDYTKYLLYTNQNRLQPQLNFVKIQQSGHKNVEENVETIKKDKTASDPSFLTEFYGNSRLHLIATLGVESKQLVNELRATPNHNFPGLERLKHLKTPPIVVPLETFALTPNPVAKTAPADEKPSEEIVMHIDMDCFFVSVGIRNRPELKGLPVAVTHSKGTSARPNADRAVEIAMYRERLPPSAPFRLQDIDDNSSLSEIASCSYEARKLGVKNGMFMGQALKLCPQLIAIPYDFQDYKTVSRTLYSTIAEYTLCIEAVSCDEMYVNLTKLLRDSKVSVETFAQHIRSIIRQRTGCPCSTGFGSNRLQARMATKRAKPDGWYHLLPEQVEMYFYDLPISELPGVGRSMVGKLKGLGIENCGDVYNFDVATLKRELGGKIGETLMEQAKGIDRKALVYEHERKSVSAEVNYGIRFKSLGEAVEFLQRLSGEVVGRLIEAGLRCKCVTLKIMARAEDAPTETAKYLGHGICDSVSRSSSLTSSTDDLALIKKEVKALFDKLQVPFAELRGLGIQLSRLEKAPKLNPVLKSFLSTAPSAPAPNAPLPNKTKTLKAILLPKLCSTSCSTTSSSTNTSSSTRGRPKGSKNTKSNSNKLKRAASNHNLTDFFKSTREDRPASGAGAKNKAKDAKPKMEVDFKVLHELPDDIREEIMKEYQLEDVSELKSTSSELRIKEKESGTSSKSDNDSKRKLENEGGNAVKPKRRKIVESAKVAGGESKFETLSHDKFMEMLANWLQTDEPQQIDVEMLAKYFEELAIQRKIERVHVYVKFLHRNISEKCLGKWHQAYFHIVEALQTGMMEIYGKRLLVPSKFEDAN